MLLARSFVVGCLVVALSANSVSAWWFSASPPPPSRPVTRVTLSPTASAANPKVAIATFDDLDGVKGFMKFTQKSASDPTLIEYNLSGLKGNNKLYHVHVRPVPKTLAAELEKNKTNATALAALCGDPATGGHLNPHKITEKLPPKSAPLEKYETGDLAGKHGPLVQRAGYEDQYLGSFSDDKLPMTGENGIIGRSIVIHKNDGKRWVCATIVETMA